MLLLQRIGLRLVVLLPVELLRAIPKAVPQEMQCAGAPRCRIIRELLMQASDPRSSRQSLATNRGSWFDKCTKRLRIPAAARRLYPAGSAPGVLPVAAVCLMVAANACSKPESPLLVASFVARKDATASYRAAPMVELREVTQRCAADAPGCAPLGKAPFGQVSADAPRRVVWVARNGEVLGFDSAGRQIAQIMRRWDAGPPLLTARVCASGSDTAPGAVRIVDFSSRGVVVATATGGVRPTGIGLPTGYRDVKCSQRELVWASAVDSAGANWWRLKPGHGAGGAAAPLLALAPEWDDGSNRPKIVPPFARELHWDVAADGTVAVVNDTVFRVAVRPPQQPWRLVTVGGVQRRAISPSALDNALAPPSAARLPPEAQRRYLETAAQARRQAPDRYPAILDVVAADSGGFWVGEAPDTSVGGRRRWTRFDATGNAVGYALLAPSDRICADAGGVMLIAAGEGRELRPSGWFRWGQTRNITTSQHLALNSAAPALLPRAGRHNTPPHRGTADVE